MRYKSRFPSISEGELDSLYMCINYNRFDIGYPAADIRFDIESDK